MINVTKSYLPDINEYNKYLEGIWERNHLTNHGPLVLELEQKLRDYTKAKHVFFVNNGTIALQIAIKALGLNKEIISTPFSYIATSSTILWENCSLVYADIDKDTLTIDPEKIKEKINENTQAILATHVYGNVCDVDAIDKIAKDNNLKVIYDAAHAFGVEYKDIPIVNYGDISTLSFHSTKLFHTIEGGAIITNDDDLAHKISYMRNFGHNGQEAFWGLGINGKSSEFNAAMGLCILPKIDEIIAKRKYDVELYQTLLSNSNLKFIKIRENTNYNFAYFPIIIESEELLLRVKDSLNQFEIYPRRYFYPSLNSLDFLSPENMPISDDISRRILCLPLAYDLGEEIIKQISNIIIDNINE